MTIAVTGAGGQLGSELCRHLGSAATGLELPDFDLTNRGGVLSALRKIRPRALINTAAYTLVDKAETEAEVCWAVNAQGVGYLAEACRELGCPLVQISTDYVFGDENRTTPYLEIDVPAPQGVYGRSKFEGERLAARWKEHIIVRTCGLYGVPGPRSPGNFVATMLRLGRTRGELRVVADQQCTPSYVPHVARAVLFLLDAQVCGTYHVANSGATTWHGFAVEIFRQAGIEVDVEPITTEEYALPAPRPCYSVLSTAKYHALANRPDLPDWRRALAEYFQTSQPVNPL